MEATALGKKLFVNLVVRVLMALSEEWQTSPLSQTIQAKFLLGQECSLRSLRVERGWIFDLPQEEKPFLGFLHQMGRVKGPSQILCDLMLTLSISFPFMGGVGGIFLAFLKSFVLIVFRSRFLFGHHWTWC